MGKNPPDALVAPPVAPAPGRRGRPTVLTDAVRKTILDALNLGAFREVAARLAGIDPSTLSRWMNAEGEPWERFQVEVEEAEARAEVRASALVLDGAEKDPKLAIAWLERRHRSRWGPSLKQEVSGPNGGPVQVQQTQVDFTKLSDEQIDRVIRGEPLASVLAGGTGSGSGQGRP